MQHALRFKQTIEVGSAGNNWYRMRLPSTPKAIAGDGLVAEKGPTSQNASDPNHPLETYYIRLSTISKVQIHPFTVAATATTSSGPIILFQKRPSKKKVTANDKEWTWLLDAMVGQSPMEIPLHMDARIEGPYITSVPGLSPASDVIAIVGGTGITGALSLANWWISRHCTIPPTKPRLKIVWSIRDIKTADIAEIYALQEHLQNLEQTADLQIHVSSQSGRLLPGPVLDSFIEVRPDSAGKNTFVYISGPEGLAAAAETACVRQKRQLRASLERNMRKEIR